MFRKKTWNGAIWERPADITGRRLTALEEHIRSLEERYASLENRLNAHGIAHEHGQWKCVECGYENDSRWLMCPACTSPEDWEEALNEIRGNKQ